jgi:hypothetical protein
MDRKGYEYDFTQTFFNKMKSFLLIIQGFIVTIPLQNRNFHTMMVLLILIIM